MAATWGVESDGLVAEFSLDPSGGLCRYRRSHEPTVSVVVPTLNEARNLPYAFWRLPPCVTEVVVVDGRSTDDTEKVARALRADIRVVRETQKGKGAALRRGFAEATGDVIVMFDADGSSDGAEIQRFVDVLVAGADFAKGSRFLPGGGSTDLSAIRTFGNLAICAAVNVLCQTRFTDLCYGYNAFWRDCLRYIDMDVAGFEVETRLNMMAARSGMVVVEVPSFEYSRVHGQSNLRPLQDGLRILRTIALSTQDILRRRPTAHVRSMGTTSGPVDFLRSREVTI
jgi:glycosyltransferase involved in cell wall biosynthesis